MVLGLTSRRDCPPNKADASKLRKVAVQVVCWVNQRGPAIKLCNSQWVSKNEHGPAPVRPIPILGALLIVHEYTLLTQLTKLTPFPFQLQQDFFLHPVEAAVGHDYDDVSGSRLLGHVGWNLLRRLNQYSATIA